jgi:predicted GIY-YIG superfamily endonuclease
MFYVYLLHSAKDKGFSIGYTTDPRGGCRSIRGGRFTHNEIARSRIVYYETYTERDDADA